jgi:hypothetical protein
MGYYANWGGGIQFKEKPSEEVLNLLDDVLCCDYFDEARLEADYSGYTKYHEEDVYKALEAAEKYTESGSIDFDGEDGCHWRFVFRDNEWTDEPGSVYYDSEIPELISRKDIPEFLGQIVDVFEDALGNKTPEFTGKTYDTAVNKLNELMRSWKIYNET